MCLAWLPKAVAALTAALCATAWCREGEHEAEQGHSLQGCHAAQRMQYGSPCHGITATGVHLDAARAACRYMGMRQKGGFAWDQAEEKFTARAWLRIFLQ